MLTEPYDDSVTDVTKAEAYADSTFLSDLLSVVVCSVCLCVYVYNFSSDGIEVHPLCCDIHIMEDVWENYYGILDIVWDV